MTVSLVKINSEVLQSTNLYKNHRFGMLPLRANLNNGQNNFLDGSKYATVLST